MTTFLRSYVDATAAVVAARARQEAEVQALQAWYRLTRSTLRGSRS